MGETEDQTGSVILLRNGKAVIPVQIADSQQLMIDLETQEIVSIHHVISPCWHWG